MPINLNDAFNLQSTPEQTGGQTRSRRKNALTAREQRKTPLLMLTTSASIATSYAPANPPLMGMGASSQPPLGTMPLALRPQAGVMPLVKQPSTKQQSGKKSDGVSAHDLFLEKFVPVAAIVWALVLWGYSIFTIDPTQMTTLGLVSVLPNTVYLAILLLTFSFTLTLHQGRAPTWLLWLHVATFIFMIHGAPALIYQTLRYSWAWKHLGIIDFIQRHGFVDPNADALKAYHNWPGFFSLFAYLFQVAGIKDMAAVAAWAPVIFNMLQIGALALIFKASTNDRRLVWQGIWFYFFANWVGQEYFSPQALNYFLHLVIVGVCLAWFRMPMSVGPQSPPRWKFLKPLANALYALRERAAHTDSQALVAPAMQRAGLLVLIVVLFFVVVTSHQLTPLMTVVAIAALVIFRRCSAKSLPLLMGVIVATWIIYGASFFVRKELYDLFETFGTFSNNINNNLIDLSNASLAQRIVAISGRALTLLVMMLAVTGCVQRIRHGKWDLSLMLLAFAPFLLLLGNGYGGEIVFRVYLFAMPFLAFFVASLLYPTIDRGNSHWIVVANLLLSLLLFAGFNLAYYGKEQMYFFTKDEVAAAQFLYSTAPPNSLLIEGSRNYPSQFVNYENFTYVPLSREKPENQAKWLSAPEDVFARWMANPDYAATYFILTRSQKAEIHSLPGTLPPNALDEIETKLRASPRFTILYTNKDAVIFTLTGRAQPKPTASTSNVRAVSQEISQKAVQGVP